MKYGTFKPLFLEEVPFLGDFLGKIPQLKFTNNDFNDQTKYPQFASDHYLKRVHYQDRGMMRLEPQQWENGLA